MIIGLIGSNIADNLLIAKIFQYWSLKPSSRSITIHEWINDGLVNSYSTIKNLSNKFQILYYNDLVFKSISHILDLPYSKLLSYDMNLLSQYVPDSLSYYDFKCLRKRSKLSEYNGLYSNGLQLAHLTSYIKIQYPSYKENTDYTLTKTKMTIYEFIHQYKNSIVELHNNILIENLFKNYKTVSDTTILENKGIDNSIDIFKYGTLPNWIVVDVNSLDEQLAILYNYNYSSIRDSRFIINIYRPGEELSEDYININISNDLDQLSDQIFEIIKTHLKDHFYV